MGKVEEFTAAHTGMELILSIVVPVFNVESFLKRCVDSLLNQDIEKDRYEIILVDDGSSDNSGGLCDSFADSESNIKVIHQTNQGLSVARNSGIAIAKGEYILFVDSDDWIEENSLRSLIQRMDDDDLDILRFGFKRVVEKDGEISIDSEERRSETDSVWTGPNYLTDRLGFICYVWQFLIKRCILMNNRVLFKPGIIFEDTEWTPRLFEKAHKVSETDALVYNYYQREGSITKGSLRKVIDGQLGLIDLLKGQMGNLENYCWHEGMIAHIVVSVLSSISVHQYPERKEYLSVLKQKGIFPLSTYQANPKAKKKINLFNISPAIACFLIHLSNK